MPLYEVAIIEKATKKERDEGAAPEKLVFGPKPIIAGDEQSAAIAAAVQGGAEFDPQKSEVIVRPFA